VAPVPRPRPKRRARTWWVPIAAVAVLACAIVGVRSWRRHHARPAPDEISDLGIPPVPPIPPMPLPSMPIPPRVRAQVMEKFAKETERAARELRDQLSRLGVDAADDADEDAPPRRSRRSVAILGFKNLSGRPSANYVSTAVAEMLATELMAGEELRTVPGESVARARRQLRLVDADSYARDTLAQLRSVLGSDYVVTGSYIVVGEGRLRLDLKLQDTSSGETVASFAENGTEADLTDLVAHAGERLRDALEVAQPSASEREGARALMPKKGDVARLYAEGLAQLRAQNCSAARGPLEQAVATDPTFPLAHSGLSEVLDCLGYDTRALEEARQAVALSRDAPAEMRLTAEAHLANLTGAHEKALASYVELHRRFPDNFDYGARLVMEALAAGDLALARKTLAALRKLPLSAGVSPQLDLVEAELDDSAKPAERLAALERARVNAEKQGARLVVAAIEVTEFKVLRRMGKLDEALAAARRAKEIFQAAGDRDGIIIGLDLEAQIAHLRKDPATVARLLDQATALGRDLDSVRSLANFHAHVGEAALHDGDLAVAQRELDTALELCDQHVGRADVGYVLGLLALLSVYRGDVERAVGYAERGAQVFRELGQKRGLGLALSAQAQLAIVRGDVERGRALAREALAAWPGLAAVGADALVTAMIADAEGRWSDAEAAARQVPEGGDDRVWTLRTQRAKLLVHALAEQGKLAEARAAVDQARARLGAGPIGLDEELILATLDAQILGASKKPDSVAAAVRALARIAERADAAGFVLLARNADLERGRLLVGSAGGRALLGETAAKAEHLHLGGLAARARALLAP
jgi:TolB-like protein